MERWALPGPRHFVAKVIGSLRDGYNLILPIPLRTVADLAGKLRENLLDDGWLTQGPFEDHVGNPVDQIFGWLNLDDCSTNRRSVATLRACLEPGSVIIVDGIPPVRWDCWRRFLLEYEAASRMVPKFDRPLIMAVVVGIPLNCLPERSAALLAMPWQDVVGELDVLLYLHDTMRGKYDESEKQKLLSCIIAKLALWDFHLADYLVELEPRNLFAPVRTLTAAASALGWGNDRESSWVSGGMIKYDGVDSEHPSLLIRDESGHRKLRERLWQAQAGELLPLIELKRHQWAKRMKPKAQLPIRINGEDFTDLDNLEIGELAHIAKIQKMGNQIENATERLKRYRNKLAHIETLEYVECFHPDLHG